MTRGLFGLEDHYCAQMTPGPTLGGGGTLAKASAFRGSGHCSSIRFLCMSAED
jgi:hypothetical protein